MSSVSDSDDRGRSSGAGEALLDDAVHRTEDIARRLDYFDIGPADAEALQQLKPLAERTVDGIVEEFYGHLRKVPELEAMLAADPERFERLQAAQRQYFLSLTDGRFDHAYFESRRQVGEAHSDVGLLPVWYIGAYALYLRLALRRLVEDSGDGARILPAVEALVKTIFLDMSLSLATYIYGGFVTREVAAQLERSVAIAHESLRAREQTERLKDEFSSMVVHDLKNPVNGISMVVQLALRKAAGLPEAHVRHLKHIDLTCREMMRLIQNLLEISKIEEGKMPVTLDAIALHEFVAEVAADHREIAGQVGRPLRTAIPADLPPVYADRDLLRRILINLVVNALRHSGSPDVTVSAVHRPATRTVELSVVDRGHGIPREQRDRVFERFAAFRRSPADEPATDSGLGLPFCKLAVEAMGGTIALGSTPGKGTTVTVTLAAH